MAKCFPQPLSPSTGDEDDHRDEGNEISIHSPSTRIETKHFGEYDRNDLSSIMHGMFSKPFAFKSRRLRERWRRKNLGSEHEDLHVSGMVLQHRQEATMLQKINKLDELCSRESLVRPCVPLFKSPQRGIEGIRLDDSGGKSGSVNIVTPEEQISRASYTDVNGHSEASQLTFSSSKMGTFSETVGDLDSQHWLDGVHFTTRQHVERCHQSLDRNLVWCGCFNNWKMEKLRRHGSRKGERGETVYEVKGKVGQPIIPDDIIEMCLARVPFSTLMKARLVCKKWKALTMSCHFFEMRQIFSSQRPWLLVFGLSRDGMCMGQIQALDPTFNKWHTISADPLSGRSFYSVAAIGCDVYIIGGCSSLPNGSGRRIDKKSLKTHKGVLAYNPLTSCWKKLSSMNTARAMPVVGVFEVKILPSSKGINRQSCGTCQDDRKSCYSYPDAEIETSTSRRFGSHDRGKKECPNMGPGFCILSRMEELTTCETSMRHETCKPLVKQSRNLLVSSRNLSGFIRSEGHPGCEIPVKEVDYGLIVVGGQGLCSEPLVSSEIYDLASNKWREVASLPVDHGIPCAGAVCNGLFYVYSETDNLAAYDFKQNVWTRIQITSPLGRLHEYIPKLLACKGRLLLLGVAWEDRDTQEGVTREKATRMIWELDPILQMWSKVSKHPDAPLDWNALFVSEGDQIYGLEMFKIFGQVLDFTTACDISGSALKWNRVSRMHITNDIDVSSCITKTAVIAQL